MTVSKTKTRKYYVSFVCEVKNPKPEYRGEEIGIAVGLKTFALTSDGESFEKPNYLKKSETSLAYWQRRIPRRQHGSSGYKKARIKVANQRRYYQHKLSKYLVENNGAICLDDLNVKGMVKSHKLAKSISDSAWGQFTSFLAIRVIGKGDW